MVDAVRIAHGQIQNHMPVVGSDGRHLGTVDRVEGDYIKLTRSDPDSGGGHEYLPISTVAGLDGGLVRLSMPAAQAAEALVPGPEMRQRLDLDPDAGEALGRPADDDPHGSRAHAHGGPKGKREHGQSGQASGPPGRTSFGAKRPV